jgi:hypothetical protein
MHLHLTLTILTVLCFSGQVICQELFHLPEGKETRWVSFENRTGDKGQGGQENQGAKGYAFDLLRAGESVDLVNIEGSGTVRRMWFTFSNRSPEMLRSLRIEMYWEGNEKPAVSAPFGDFFGVGLGRRVPFESALFSDPEGRSFNCIIPMPFREGARITVTNDSDRDIGQLFYDIDLLMEEHADNVLYFHTYWSRMPKTTLGEDFPILPTVMGSGRFLGTNMGIFTDPLYENTWWGEGEVKMYIDGDDALPTIVGTGTEDYVGTAYGQGTFDHQYQGSLVIDNETGAYAFYRYHIPDPVYFYKDIQVTIQQIGGAPIEHVRKLVANGATLEPITIHHGPHFTKLLDRNEAVDINDPNLPKGWTNFYRQDDVSATAYFYLDRPVSNLPPLADLQDRTTGLRTE